LPGSDPAHVPQDPIAFLLSLERLGMKFGLENITALCAALGDPQQAFRSVIVAGTNGKGSVTAMTETGLRAAGHRTGRYTSPHLTRLEERFAIAGREVDTEALRGAAAQVQAAVQRALARGTLEGPPTFFECATAIAFVLFRDAAVDVAVLEVGLGGRLDATNVVQPMAAAITSIDFDHQAQLGDTLEAIAREKAGVIKPGIPVVCGILPPEAVRAIRARCEAVGATMVIADDERELEALLGGAPVALKGAHQRANAAVAVRLLAELDARGLRVDPAARRAAVTDVDWPGRLEETALGGTRVLLDAAHNPAGARALAAYLRETRWTDCALVFGAMADKDAEGMLRELAPLCSAIVCVTAPSPRAVTASALAAVARRTAPGVLVEEAADPGDALRRAAALRNTVVVAGSIFLTGPLRAILRGP
jgi:dihydrofolate synthase/folylpolyglutamate synthase